VVNLRKSKKNLGWLTQQETESIARDLGVKPKEVSTMEQRFASKDMAFDGKDTEDDFISPSGFLPAPDSDPAETIESYNWLEQNTELLAQAMEKLDIRSKEILTARWLSDDKLTLKALAKKYNISLERVRQIEENAIIKLRESFTQA